MGDDSLASPIRTGVALGLAVGLTLLGLGLASAPMLAGDDVIGAWGLNGLSAIGLLPVQGLLALTLVCFICAIAVPQTRLALVQSIAVGVWGIAMALLGLMLLAGGLASFASKLALLLAFPFGTIAYFVLYSCGADTYPLAVGLVGGLLGGACMAGTQTVALAVLILKAGVLGLLLIASPRFLKVSGLMILFALLAGMIAAIVGGYWMLQDLPFLLYPLDGVIMALLGVVVLIHGIVTFVKSLIALALAIAGQVG